MLFLFPADNRRPFSVAKLVTKLRPLIDEMFIFTLRHEISFLRQFRITAYAMNTLPAAKLSYRNEATVNVKCA